MRKRKVEPEPEPVSDSEWIELENLPLILFCALWALTASLVVHAVDVRDGAAKEN